MKKTLITLVAMVFVSMPSFAQENKEFSVDVQLRPRAEYRNGQGTLAKEGSQTSAFVSNRARVGLNYKSSLLDLRVSGQHVGTWGAEGQQKTSGDFTMNEAWAKLHTADGRWYAQMGRQALSYDDQRILGGLDWAQTGRYHDGLKLGYNTKGDKFDLILAFNQNAENKTNVGTYFDASTGQPYKTMETFWYNHQFGQSKFAASFLIMNVGWETGTSGKGETTNMQTLGTYLTYAPGTWNFTGSIYFQTGKDATKEKVSAYTWSITAADKLSDAVSVNAGIDFRSGDDNAADGTNHTFDQLYGTHHKFYGTMDYFMQKVAKGIWDPRIGATFRLSQPVSLDAVFHHFVSNKKINDKKALGSEIDLQLNYKMMKDVTLQAGFSTMLACDGLKTAGTDYKSFQSWGWLSVNINPTIFSTRKK